MNKRLRKQIASYGCFDKSLIVLSVTTCSISIALFGTVIGAPLGKINASFSLVFEVLTGIVKELLKKSINKKKKHSKFAMLARSKLNSIEFKISEVLINSEISHEDFVIIINKEKNRELE